MTPTKHLCELLDELGVRWLSTSPNKIAWERDGITFTATNAWPRNDETRTRLVVHVTYPTSEQAIEATLGREDTFTREDVESAFVSGYSLGSLPVGSDPSWDENRQTVEDHMAELGWERSRGTCKDVHESPNDGTFWPSPHFKCSKCGKTHVSMECVCFCPSCGAEVVDG